MQTIPQQLSRAQAPGSKSNTSLSDAVPRTWATSLRLEHRHGVTRYVVNLSDGQTTATLLGAVDSDSPLSPSETAWKAAAEWLSHVGQQPSQIVSDRRRMHRRNRRTRRAA